MSLPARGPGLGAAPHALSEHIPDNENDLFWGAQENGKNHARDWGAMNTHRDLEGCAHAGDLLKRHNNAMVCHPVFGAGGAPAGVEVAA